MQVVDIRGRDAEVKDLMSQARRIAVVGLSPKTQRPSNMVARYLIEKGFEVIPVNPGLDEVLGLRCYPDLQSIPVAVDIVDIFRRSEEVLPLVEKVLQLASLPKAIWMQLAIVNMQAAELAKANGISVVMDRCIKVEHQRLMGV